jgi:hypothetical protein
VICAFVGVFLEYFAVLSDTETDESTNSPAKPKERIPPIVLYSHLTNHSQTLKTLKDKLNSPVEIKTKTDRLLLYIKTVNDYELVLHEIKTAKLAYHTYQLPNKQKPRLTLKGIPPNVETEDITAELTQLRLQVANIRQIT